MTADNPLLDPAFSIRWSVLTPALVEPAIETALQRAQANIDEVANRDLASLTYTNTVLALERAAEELTIAWGKVTHLQSVADSPALREAHNAMLPKVSAFYAKISLNAALWTRLKAFSKTTEAAQLTGIHRRFLDETLADFRQAGADLPVEKQARLEALQSELAQLTQKYAENVLDATNAWQVIVEDETRLAGIPEHAKGTARRNADSKGLGSPEKPAWRFTLHGPSQEPVMTYAEDATLRAEVWAAGVAVGAQAPYDNSAVVQRILGLRAEKAALLGKAHFADVVLERRMAKTGNEALTFITDLETRVKSMFARECGELEEFKAQQTGQPAGHLGAWEVGFWAEKLRQSRYDFDEEVLRPYFPMNRVIEGLFELAREIFGLRIEEQPAGAVEVWHPEVKFYDMRGADGRHLGSFYADWYPRESKRGGAWMGYLLTGDYETQNKRAPHLGYICGNLTPPGEGRPALLTHREVQTIFHEFGHLIHHLLGEVEIKSLNGVNVAWDFVELPSQIMENWCWQRESLDLFARHFETVVAIPESIFRKMIAARNFRAACGAMRQVQFSKMDLLLHMRPPEFLKGDIEATARAAVAECFIPTEPPGRTIVKRFNHLFSDPVGYAAGYYSYKWAEVLEADAFTRFLHEGIFSSKVGAELVDKVLSRGNSAPPAELFRAFMGREPDLNALLRRSGLVTAA